MTPVVLASLLVGLLCALVVVAPLLAARRLEPGALVATLTVLGLLGGALAVHDPALGYALLALIAVLHGACAWSRTRTGAVGLWLAAAATAVAAAALQREAGQEAFLASLLAIALRAGVMPLHPGVAALVERAPRLQTQQLGSTIALVYLHLRFVDHLPLASDLAPALVRWGAVVTLLPAIISLAVKDALGWMRCSTLMHGGLLFCGVGAAGRGHYAAALLEAIALALALGGMGVVIAALEERCGRVRLDTVGGRARSLPRLCAAFAIFGAAGVGLPASAGFIADDLLLHALWEASRLATAVVILGTAILAVATLVTWSKVFLGPPQRSLAPDLHLRERLALVALVLALLVIGLAPQLLMTPVTAVLGAGLELHPPA